MKSILIIILLSVITFNTRSQILTGYGVKFGGAISNQTWDYGAGFTLNNDNKVGVSPRLFADFFNLPYLQLEGELGFTRKGFTESIPITTTESPDGTGEYININNSLDYLSISVLGKIRFEAGKFSPYIIAGPQVNFLINKNFSSGWDIVFDQFRKTNLGLSVGAGTELNDILPFTILLEYRYERDFMDNYDSPYIKVLNYSHVILAGIKL
jgi:opacity protein-like surface antigen